MTGSFLSRQSLTPVARALLDHHRSFDRIPALDLDEAARFIDRCFSLILPHLSPVPLRSVPEIEARLTELAGRLRYILCEVMPAECAQSDKIASEFLESLPTIAQKVRADAQALYDNDPAAASIDEVIMAYPGLYAVAAYRVARALRERGVGLFPRLIAQHAQRVTGIEINPGAVIGDSFFIDHGTGVVIGETAVIGNNVKLYQGVTLGALKVRREDCAQKRHPTIEDNVVIYAHATILGGETVIGRNSTIGGNVWITKSVPPHSRVMYRSMGWQGLSEPEPTRADDFTI